MKTKADVIRAALRRAKVVAVDEEPQADMAAETTVIFDGLTVEFQQFVDGDGFWTNIPEHVFEPLVLLVAADVAPMFGQQVEWDRGQAMVRLMAQMRPDDREEVEAEMF